MAVIVPVRPGPGRLVPEPVPAVPPNGTCLSLPEPLKDRKKRCIINFLKSKLFMV